MKWILLIILLLLVGCSHIPENVKNITIEKQKYVTLMLIAEEDMDALFNGKTYKLIGNTIEQIPNVPEQSNYTIIAFNEKSYPTINICEKVCRLNIAHKGTIEKENLTNNTFRLKFIGDVREPKICFKFIGDVWWIGMNAQEIDKGSYDVCYIVQENITYETKYIGNGTINSMLFT